MSGERNARRWTIQIIRCGGCGQPRGVRHTCVRRPGSRPRRTRVKPEVRVRCRACGQRRSPFGLHTCMVKTDFKTRTRRHAAARQRARATAARKRRRQRETEARRARRQRETDARKRRREREREASTARRARERARRKQAGETRRSTPPRERNRKPAPTGPRPRRPDYHPYDQCRDDECQRKACVAYREGVEDCPLPHGV